MKPAPPIIERIRIAIAKRSDGDGALNLVAALTGAMTALVSVGLYKLVGLVQAWGFGANPTMITTFVVPIIGGAIVSAILWLSPGSGGPGTGETLNAVARNIRLPSHTILGKTTASAVAIGTGASGGREGPSVQIGATIGQVFSRFAAMDIDQTRTMMAAGAAAGISAAFNAPISGMIFAMEVIIGAFAVRSLQAVVVSSVVASVVAHFLLGNPTHYAVYGDYTLKHPLELVGYLLLGVLATLVARALMIARFHTASFLKLDHLPTWLKPIVSGAIIGVVAIGMPEVIGMGEHLPALTNLSPSLGTSPLFTFISGGPNTGLMGMALVALLIIAKIMATGVSINLGQPVGTLAPCLFLGAALGTLSAQVTAYAFNLTSVSPGPFAVVGMAAVLGASMKAPMTAILLIFELTGAYNLVVPMMLATGMSVYLADRLWDHSMFTWALYQTGERKLAPETQDVLQTVGVAEIMNDNPKTVPPTMSVADLTAFFERQRVHSAPVVRGDTLLGIVAVSDVQNHEDLINRIGAHDTFVDDIATPRVTTVTSDDMAWTAMRRMGAMNVGRLPVVDPKDRTKLVGLVSRADLVRAYQHGMIRSLSDQQARAQSRLRNLGSTSFNEATIHPQSALCDRRVSTITWPAQTVLVSVRRGDDVTMPNGNTVLRAHDVMVFVAPSEQVHLVKALIEDPSTEGTLPTDLPDLIDLADADEPTGEPKEGDQRVVGQPDAAQPKDRQPDVAQSAAQPERPQPDGEAPGTSLSS